MNKDEVLSALSSFVSAFANYSDELEVRINNLEQENAELRGRNTELGNAFEVIARILKRGSDETN